jgi:hypothetical protein
VNEDFLIHYFEPVRESFQKAEIILKNHPENLKMNDFGISDIREKKLIHK